MLKKENLRCSARLRTAFSRQSACNDEPAAAYPAQACAKEALLGFDHSAPKRPVNLNLNSDLIEQCRSGVSNLSAYVEDLLAADLEQRQAKLDAKKQRTAQAINAFVELYHEHGGLSEEMQKL
jgi:antitoxin CcdA